MYEYTFQNKQSGELLPIFSYTDNGAWAQLDNWNEWELLFVEYVD